VTTTPALSVVVPTWNRVQLLTTCLDSLVTHGGADGALEIVVVDDGSTDATEAVVMRMAQAHRGVPVRLVRSEHRGVNAARNIGVRSSTGDLVCFIDDDTEVMDGWVTELIEGANRYPEIGVFAGRIVLRLEGRPPRMCGREPLGETHLDLGDRDRGAEEAWGACLMTRRTVLDRVGPFNEAIPKYGTETEWVNRYKASGGRIVYLANAGLWHRRSAESLRVTSLLGRSFGWGRDWAITSRVTGRRCSVAGAIASVARGLLHGVRFGCFVGFRNAVSGSGTAFESTWMLLSGGGGRSISWLPSSGG
jgi:GT2 family glycosyltransferase